MITTQHLINITNHISQLQRVRKHEQRSNRIMKTFQFVKTFESNHEDIPIWETELLFIFC